MKVSGKHEYQAIPTVNSTDNLIGSKDTTAAPTVNSDSSAGYYVGYRWTDSTTGLTYVCVDDTAGAAIWTDYGSDISNINTVLSNITPQSEILGGGLVYSGTGWIYDNTIIDYRINGILYQIAAATASVTLAAADPTNDRIDLVYVKDDETIGVVTGTPAAAPSRPALPDPSSQLILTFISVPALATAPTTNTENIYLENVEWTGSVSGTGSSATFNDTNPNTGSLNVDANLQAVQGGAIGILKFDRGSAYTLPGDLTATSLNFQINFLEVLPFAFNLRVRFRDASNNICSNSQGWQGGYFGGLIWAGVNASTTNTYQLGTVALSTFNFTADPRYVEFYYYRATFPNFGPTSNTLDFRLDDVKIIDGNAAPVQPGYVITDGNASGDGTNGQVALWNSDIEVIGSDAIKYVINPGTKVGIDMVDSSDESRATFEAGSAQVISDQYAATMRVNSYSNADPLHGGILQLRRGRGTEGTPLGCNTGDQVGVIDVYGFHDGGGVPGEAVIGQIAFVALDTYADSANIGTLFQISTAINDGAGTFSARYRITEEGYHRFYDRASIALGADPSAILHLGPGSTTVPAVRMTTQANVSAPTNGDLWWNSTNLNFRSGGVTYDLLVGSGGTVTSVATGTGLSGGPITASGTIDLDFDNIAEKTGDLVGSDRLTGVSGTTHFSETISGIPLSIFNNDSGWTSNTGTVTSVATSGTVNGLTLTGGPITTTGTVTLGGTLAINNSDWSGTDLAVANGGTGLSTVPKGSVLVANALDTISALAGVTDGHVLTYNSGTDTISWSAPAGGGGGAAGFGFPPAAGNEDTYTGSGEIRFMNYIIPSDITISSAYVFFGFTGSEFIKLAIYRGWDGSATLACQSNGVTSPASKQVFTMTAEAGENLDFTEGEQVVLAYSQDGTGGTKAICVDTPADNNFVWTDFTEVPSGGNFSSTPGTKDGTTTFFPAIWFYG